MLLAQQTRYCCLQTSLQVAVASCMRWCQLLMAVVWTLTGATAGGAGTPAAAAAAAIIALMDRLLM